MDQNLFKFDLIAEDPTTHARAGEVIFYRVVICWSCNDDEVCVFIGFCSIGRGL